MKLFTATATAAALALAAVIGRPAAAAEISEFRIGILGGENQTDRLKSHECLRAQTEKLLGVKTTLYAPADYNGVIEGLIGGNLDMAWLGASGYAKAYLKDSKSVEPVLVPINPDGSTGYYSIGFARADKKIQSLKDMKGKVFAFGDPNSTSGFLIPSIEIPAAGFSMDDGKYFGKIAFSGGHEQTIVGVYNGDYDGGVTWADGQGEWETGFNNGAFRKAVDSGIVDMTQLVEIWRSKLIPNGPVVLRTTLPGNVKKTMVDYMLNLHKTDKDCLYGFMAGEVKGMMSVDHKFFESIVAARKKKIGG
jgi:phosphonate transport system substrate-binding protein